MASSYDNDLRLNEQGTGDNSGSWGTVTNLNLEMIAEAFSYGTRAIANASTDNITLADGALDADRSMYLRLSGGGQACTVTLLPNTVSKVWMIENATSATLTFTQGSGANVAVLAGQVKMIATDGAGSGAVVYDLLTDVNLAGTTVTDIITANQATVDDIDLNGKVITMTGSSGDTATITVAADGALAIATTDAAAAAANISITADGTFTSAATTITLDSAGDIILDAAGDEVIFKDGSANIGHVSMDSDNLTIKSLVSDKDIILQGNDGGSGITALTLDMSAAGAATFNSTVTRALTRGSIDVGNSSGVSSALAAGGAATVLTSDGTDIAWAAAASGGADPVVFPNLASPNNTYTSSGTWSKGSLDDDAYVWFYLCGGGRGGFSDNYPSTSAGGYGGAALLVYGQAVHFDGAAYLIGAGGVGGNSGGAGGYPGATKLTTTSTQGSIVYQPYDTTWNDTFATDVPNKIMLSVPTSIVNQTTTLISGRTKTPYDFIFAADSEPTGWSGAETQGNLYAWSRASPAGSGLYATNGIFGGGGGGGRIQYGGNSFIQPPGGSLYAGAGGTHSGGNGAVPGGGGAGNSSAGQAGNGGAGNMRVYHV